MTRQSFIKFRALWPVFIAACMAIPASGCIIVDDDNCPEGDFVCHGDYIEECIDDEWVVYDDCGAGWCGGTCDYVNGDAACFCP